jgi:hypothetical protein
MAPVQRSGYRIELVWHAAKPEVKKLRGRSIGQTFAKVEQE